jgi:hypothetical protein
MSMDFENIFACEGVGGHKIKNEAFIQRDLSEHRRGVIDSSMFERVGKIRKKIPDKGPRVCSRNAKNSDRLWNKGCRWGNDRIHFHASNAILILLESL